MNNLYGVILLFVAMSVCQRVKADGQLWRSLDEMEEACSLVLDGTVTGVTDIGNEVLGYAAGKPVIRTRRRAIFKIEKILKGQIDPNLDSVPLVYWKVADSLYRGEVAPDLQENDHFRLFAETVVTEKSGEVTIYLHSRNAVRPEALTLASLPVPEGAPPIPISKLPGGIRVRSEKFPEFLNNQLSEESSLTKLWNMIMVFIIASIGILYVCLRERK